MDSAHQTAGRQPVAFISHHSSQVETARKLKALLGQNGITGWMAPDDIDPGRPFDQAIIEQVRQSDLIILLFCSKSDQSRHVKRELMMAENNHKLIYPVRLEETAADGLAYWLNDYQWVDWFDGNDNDPIKRMIATIQQQAAVKDGGTAAPPPPPATAAAPPPQPAPIPAPAPGGGWKSWAIPLASAAIVGIIMLAGFYFMTRDDGGNTVEAAAAETTTETTGEAAPTALETQQADTSQQPAPQPSTETPVPQPAATGGYYVVLGSYPPGSPQADQRAADFQRCAGMAAAVSPSDAYAGFRPGLTVVVIGPYADRRVANEALGNAQSCVADAYLRRTG
jgi:hypothetical protein